MSSADHFRSNPNPKFHLCWIVEWIYSNDIKALYGLSQTLLFDLEKLYLAAETVLLFDLCQTIKEYLVYHLVNEQTFGVAVSHLDVIKLERELERSFNLRR
jgi:hypothetical protein